MGGVFSSTGQNEYLAYFFKRSYRISFGSTSSIYLGSKFNGDKTRKFIDKYGKFLFISLNDLERSEKWFSKYGVWTVLIFRMVPLGRSIISIPAGFIKMNVYIFASLTFVGTFIWSFILTYAGYTLGEHWTKVSEIISTYEHIVIYALIALIGVFIYTKRHKIPVIKNLRIKKA